MEIIVVDGVKYKYAPSLIQPGMYEVYFPDGQELGTLRAETPDHLVNVIRSWVDFAQRCERGEYR